MVKVQQDLTGMIFNRLTVIQQVEDYVSPSGKHYAMWLCECSCEAHTKLCVLGNALKQRQTQSCGCLQRECVIKSNKNNHTYHKYDNHFDLSGEYGTLLIDKDDSEIVLFDLEDADMIMTHQWCIDGDGYVATRINNKLCRMHQLIIGADYDHINKNKLDNRKCNLRVATHQENCRNRPKQKNNTSGVTGVGLVCGKWYARIWIDGKLKHLGVFMNKEDAIRTRLRAESKYFGEFAPQINMFDKYGVNQINIKEKNNELC